MLQFSQHVKERLLIDMINQQVQAVTIAGHDSDGSAGMPADLHAFFVDGVYGHGLLTAAVSGNSKHYLLISRFLLQKRECLLTMM